MVKLTTYNPRCTGHGFQAFAMFTESYELTSYLNSMYAARVVHTFEFQTQVTITSNTSTIIYFYYTTVATGRLGFNRK